VSGFDGTRTITYTGPTPEEAQRAFELDSERARASGYVNVRSWWDPDASQPTLIAEYRAAPSGPMPPGVRAGVPAPTRPRPNAFREALLITAIVLAGIVALAVSIPTAPPPVASPVPASPAPASAAPAARALDAAPTEPLASIAPSESGAPG
jgi:hypothetical protein